MLRPIIYYVFAVSVAMISLPAIALAQSAFVEGHVFNTRTGAPLAGATVRVTENITAGPVPIELAAGVTDANGFYQFEIDEFLGAYAVIEVTCETTKRPVHGASSAVLREGLIRRDIYLEATRRTTSCQSDDDR